VTQFPALDAAGLRYAVRTTSAGAPYAALRWSSRDPSHQLALTMLESDSVVRLTAHGVARDDAGGLARLNFTTRRLPRGRLFRPPDSDASDLAVTLWGDRRRATGDLWAALTYLEDVRDWLEGRAPAPEEPSPPRPLEEVAVDGVDVHLGLAPAGHLVGTAEVPLPPLRIDAPTAAWVDRLQWWAPTGRFLLGPSDTLVAEVSSDPLRDDGAEAGLRTRVAHAAVVLVQEAVRTAA
jgi:hypothetical protein